MLVIFAWLMMAFTAVAGLVYQPAPSAGTFTDYQGYNVWVDADTTPDISSGLIHHYELAEFTNALGKIVDSSATGTNTATPGGGTAAKMPTWIDTGYLEYDGEQQVTGNADFIKTDNKNFPGGDWSAAFNVWLGNASLRHIVFSAGAASPSTCSFGAYSDAYKIQVLGNAGTPVRYSGVEDFYNWVHVVMTREASSGTIKIYLNGGEVTNAASATTTVEDSQIEWGLDTGDNNNYCHLGYQGDYRLYDRILTAAQIEYLYEQDGRTPVPKNIKFTDWETNSTDFIDESGNEWDFESLPSIASGASVLGASTNAYLSFDNLDDRLVADTKAAPRGNVTNLTISMWIDRDGTDNEGLLTTRDTATALTPLRLAMAGSRVRMFMGTDGLDSWRSTVDTLQDGWHHVAVVYDGSQAINTNRGTIYVNGVDVTDVWSADIDQVLGAGAAGDYYVGWDIFYGYYDGLMDDLIVTNVSWTYSQVTNEYDNGNGRN